MSEITEFRNEVMSMFAMMIQRFDAMDQRFDAMDQRFDAMDQRLNAMDQRLDAMDQRLDAMDQRFEEIDHRFDEMERGFLAGFKDLSNLIGAFQSETNKRLDNIEDRLSDLESWRKVVQFKRM